MHYLYKLVFPNGVHFGSDMVGVGLEKISPNCHADTLYSALCHEILKLEGESALLSFYNETVNGDYLFSDLLPYKESELTIPKPVFFHEKSEEKRASDSVQKKKIKSIQFVQVSQIKEYFDGSIEALDFEKSVLYEKCAPSRQGEAENGLYSVAVTRFKENCGLYFIVKMNNDKKGWFDNIIKSLSFSGLGGKRTSGYGMFRVVQAAELGAAQASIIEKKLAEMLLKRGAAYYMALSAFYPQSSEVGSMKSGYYSLVKRQGFVQSQNYAENLVKKIPLVMVNAGSCFKERFVGEVLDVSKSGSHPVYRYGKPIMIGIDI